MASSAEQVKDLRERTGAGVMDCKAALEAARGDLQGAVEYLRKKGLADAAKKSHRDARDGVVVSYIHPGSKIGVLVEVNCETDFVANTDEFKTLARDICLHIASAVPQWVHREDIPEDILTAERRIYEAEARQAGKPDNVIDRIVEGKLEGFYKTTVLVDQAFVKDTDKTIRQLVDEVSAKVGEKVAVRRFVRYKLGEDAE
jgi:elongation factor Ts